MRIMMYPTFLFHITKKRSWGEKKVLAPKIKGINRGCGEPEISRTCVASTITGCFLAIPYYPGESFYVYRTYHKVRGYYPYDVCDSRMTREKWLLSPTTFIKVGYISRELLNAFPPESNCDEFDQYEFRPIIRNILRNNTDIPKQYI